MAGSSPSSE
jgi:hypothetical protein